MCKQICLFACFLFTAIILKAQNIAASQIFKSPDNEFRIGLPANWIIKPGEDKGDYFDCIEPTGKDDMISSEIYIYSESANSNENLRDMVARSRAHQATNKKINLLDSSFAMFNNKEWFRQLYTISLTKKNQSKLQTFETIYNGKYYRITYRSSTKNFDTFKENAYNSLLSFMFLDKDQTPANASTALSSAQINSLLSKMKGVYQFNNSDLIGGYSRVVIEDGGNNIFKANATETMISTKAPYDEELTANLKVVGVDGDNYVIMMMDDVTNLKEDGKYLLTKNIYKLKLTNNNLVGDISYYTGVNDQTVGNFTTLQRKATAIPAGNSSNTIRATPVFKLDHKIIGASSLEELGRKILAAFKNNDVQSYLQYIVYENTDDIKKYFGQVRDQLGANGVTDWSKVQFSRITYFNRQDKADNYSGFSIEFDYGTSFWGAFSTQNGAMKQNGKYYLDHSYNNAGIRRK